MKPLYHFLVIPSIKTIQKKHQMPINKAMYLHKHYKLNFKQQLGDKEHD